MRGRLNLDRGTLNLDGGTLTLDEGTRPPYNLSTSYSPSPPHFRSTNMNYKENTLFAFLRQLLAVIWTLK